MIFALLSFHQIGGQDVVYIKIADVIDINEEFAIDKTCSTLINYNSLLSDSNWSINLWRW